MHVTTQIGLFTALCDTDLPVFHRLSFTSDVESNKSTRPAATCPTIFRRRSQTYSIFENPSEQPTDPEDTVAFLSSLNAFGNAIKATFGTDIRG